jgi:ribosome-associated toxin RatA of RatAB toxin-antitoxin module
MKSFTKKENVPFSASQMYDLVNDVNAYDSFLPYCTHSIVLIDEPTHMQASLSFAAYGIEKSFTTDNTLIPNKSITIKLVEGPFEDLSGYWQFKSDARQHCNIELAFSYEISSWIRPVFEPIFEEIAEKWLSVFIKRAHEVYGQ